VPQPGPRARANEERSVRHRGDSVTGDHRD
jgi:hypothetical protein